MENARRYNNGKLRYELISQNALADLAEVYTKGAEKYTIRDDTGQIIENGANNWKKGLPWMDAIASVQRHIESWKSGEDFDPDLGTKHLANAAWGLFALLDFYKSKPNFDNRNHSYLNKPRIGLDVDELCAGFCEAYGEITGVDKFPNHWSYCDKIQDNFKKWKEDDTLDNFYLNKIQPLVKGSDLLFEPTLYITHRPVSNEITLEWLKLHKFPLSPVYTAKAREEKVKIALENNLDFFIDDNMDTFIEMKKAGVCCFLMDASHNRKYDVGYLRVKNLKDFSERFL